METVNVLIVGNQPIFRLGLHHVLSSNADIRVVGECSLNEDACSMVANLSPDIALVEVISSSLEGFGMVQQIATRFPKVAVIALSSRPNDDQLIRAIKSGSVALLGKDISPGGLADVIKRVGQGECPINASLLDRPNSAMQVMDLFRRLAIKDRGALMTPLSRRELEILGYVSRGNANKYIAVVLSVSEQTVKNHLTSILRKLNANDRTQAVVLAARQGWLNLNESAEKTAEEELSAELV